MGKQQRDSVIEGQDPLAIDNSVPEGLVDIGRDWPFYKPEHCKLAAIYGRFVDRVEMPPTENGDWEVALVQLLRPTYVVEPDDTVRVAAVGEVVALPLSASLQSIKRFSGHPSKVFTIYVKPKGKIPLGGGKTMWTYDIRANPVGEPRLMPVTSPLGITSHQAAATAALEGASQQSRQLPGVNGSQRGALPVATGSDAEIPF